MQFENPIDFIKFLKSEHRAIVSTISDVENQAGGPSDLKSSVDKLNRVTEILFDHLEKEDKQLYPTLLNNKNTSQLAKKYFYDMERLSCMSLDFFKRYCINREGQKIFVEDFINAFSLFKGLLKIRIKREEIELYPAYILLQSGVMYSEVIEYVQERETNANNKQKTVVVFGQDEPCKKALSLALEMNGYAVASTSSMEEVERLRDAIKPDLFLIDLSKTNNELCNLVVHLKDQIQSGARLVGYSISEESTIEERIGKNLDNFIAKPAYDVEKFSNRIKELLSK